MTMTEMNMEPPKKISPAMMIVYILVTHLGAVGIGLICWHSTDTDANVIRLEGMGKLYNFGWMGLSLFTIVVMLKLNSKVASMARKLSDIKIPDEHVYRTVEGDCVVVLDNTGKNGEWNRAQRGLHNWTEGPLIVMQAEVLLIAFAIGASGFILATLIGMSRILFTVGYSRDTKKRIPGFVLSATLENAAHFLILFLSIKAGFKSGL